LTKLGFPPRALSMMASAAAGSGGSVRSDPTGTRAPFRVTYASTRASPGPPPGLPPPLPLPGSGVSIAAAAGRLAPPAMGAASAVDASAAGVRPTPPPPPPPPPPCAVAGLPPGEGAATAPSPSSPAAGPAASGGPPRLGEASISSVASARAFCSLQALQSIWSSLTVLRPCFVGCG
jgi:hypothetical protein